MIIDKKYPLLAKPSSESAFYQSITCKEANWRYLNFKARLLQKGDKWEEYTGDNEYGIILLGGNYSVKTDKGSWKTVNGRRDVFSGMAHTLYLPRHTSFVPCSVDNVLCRFVKNFIVESLQAKRSQKWQCEYFIIIDPLHNPDQATTKQIKNLYL